METALQRPWHLCFLTCFIFSDLHLNSIIPLPWPHPTVLLYPELLKLWKFPTKYFFLQGPQNSSSTLDFTETSSWFISLCLISIFLPLLFLFIFISLSQQFSWHKMQLLSSLSLYLSYLKKSQTLEQSNQQFSQSSRYLPFTTVIISSLCHSLQTSWPFTLRGKFIFYFIRKIEHKTPKLSISKQHMCLYLLLI